MLRRLSAVLAAWFAIGVCHAATTSIIVELEGDPAAVYKAKQEQQGLTVTTTQLANYRQSLTAAQSVFLQRAAAAGITGTVATTKVYNHLGNVAATIERRYTLVYNGLALTVPVEQVSLVGDVAGVRNVHHDRMLRAHMDKSVDYIRAPRLYGAVPELTQFDDIREGYEGQGINIAVIDTGIEWQHEMFGGDPTPPRLGVNPVSALIPTNQKVIYYLPMGDLAVEDGVGHGTHVSSTTAGYRGYGYGQDGIPMTADDLPIHGVAPQAKIMSYGVCANVLSIVGSLTGAIGGCLNSNTILALEDAVSPRTVNGFTKPVAHVINMSLGGDFGTADDPTAVAASNAALMGAVVVAAAGNSGDVPQIVGSPSTGRRVISVAASNDPGVLPHSINVVDASGTVVSGSPTIIAQKAADSNLTQEYHGGVAGHYVYAGFADTPDQVPDSVSGRICLVVRGSTATVADQGSGLFSNKAAQCTAKGAIATVIFNNEPGMLSDILAPSPNVVFTLSDADGLYLRDTLGFDGNGVSVHPIRLNGPSAELFEGGVTGFSSRGPVQGFGQVKPDLSAPGSGVLAAVPPASLMGALAAVEQGPNYGSASGTSMATPHVAGAAALVKQANPGWHPDKVRTALINTATPFRDRDGNPAAYGAGNPPVNAQGGGLIDVNAAARAKALMGVVGDGVIEPFILGSHSFGQIPILGNLCETSREVTVTIADQRGAGGSYRISAHANHATENPGVTFMVPQDDLVVPPGGSVSFSTGVSIDSTTLDPDAPFVEFQWFVVAERTDGTETLSMPFFLRGTPSVPGEGIGGLHEVTESFTGTNPGGTPAVVFISDHDITVPLGTLRILATLEGDELVNGALTEVELHLIDEAGAVVAISNYDGNFEVIDYPNPAPGAYIVQVRSDTGGPVSFDLTVVQTRVTTPEESILDPIDTEYVDPNGGAVDFDGAFGLAWSGTGAETGFTIEQRRDGGSWEPLASVVAGTTTHSLSGLENGTYEYRILAEYAGAICSFVMPSSNARSVVVALRHEVAITSDVSWRITAASFVDGIFSVDLVLINNSSETFYNPVTLDVVGISSGSGDIRVINADNSGSGTSPADRASFSYASQLGDDAFAPGEATAARTLRFADPNGQLFTFQAETRAQRAGAAAAPVGEAMSGGPMGDPVTGASVSHSKARAVR